MVNIDPPDDLADRHTSDFRGAYRECIVPKFRDFDEPGYQDDLQNFIDQEQEHRRLINYSIFPFVESSPEGYRFVRADPLEELQVKNFDFLLHDFEGHVIFGEAKASLPSNIASEINDIVRQREIVDEKSDYIEREYLGQQIRHAEFVLTTYSDYADNAA